MARPSGGEAGLLASCGYRSAITRTLRLEATGQFRRAAAGWERYQETWGEEDTDGFISQSEPPQIRCLDDRIAALRAWRGPRDTPALRVYLDARDRLNVGNYSVARPLLARLTREPYRTRAEYIAASVRFYTESPEAGAAAFRAFLKRHPRNALALYMIGRCYFRAVRRDETGVSMRAGRWARASECGSRRPRRSRSWSTRTRSAIRSA